MSLHQVPSFVAGTWIAPGPGARTIASAITGEPFATAGNTDLNVQAMLDHARNTGGPRPARHDFPSARADAEGAGANPVRA